MSRRHHAAKKYPDTEHCVEVIDLAHDGRGIARIEGKVVFIADALPGEQVRISHRRVSKQYDEGRVLEVLRPSPHRVVPQCAHFGRCGGCVLQHSSSDAQREFKQKHLADNLLRIGKTTPQHWLNPLTGPTWGYRRRARFGVKDVPGKGRVLVGFRERASAFLADIERCEVVAPRVSAMLPALSELVGKLSLRNRVPQIEVSVADNAIALVIRTLQPITDSDRVHLLTFSHDQDCWIFLQPGGMETIYPLREATPALVFGLPKHGISITFEPADFIQINGAVNEAMVDLALDLLAPKSTDRILELFCGLGNFSLPLARRVEQVWAVEGDAGLVVRAQKNAERNDIHNVAFYRGDLFKTQDAAWLHEPFDLVLLDPPRAGAQEILPLVAARQPRRMVYVSCHPATLARDANILVEQFGYTLSQAGVMDMFPHTQHVESIAVFDRSL